VSEKRKWIIIVGDTHWIHDVLSLGVFYHRVVQICRLSVSRIPLDVLSCSSVTSASHNVINAFILFFSHVNVDSRLFLFSRKHLRKALKRNRMDIEIRLWHFLILWSYFWFNWQKVLIVREALFIFEWWIGFDYSWHSFEFWSYSNFPF